MTDGIAAAATVLGMAVTIDSTVSIPSPTSSVPNAGTPKRTARPWTQPSALRERVTFALIGWSGSNHVRSTPQTAPQPGRSPRTGVFSRVACDGSDQRRQAADAAAVEIEERGMEAQRREPAAREPPGTRVGLGVGAVDGAAVLAQAARRVGRVVVVEGAGGGRNRQGEEGARLGKGGAQRARA